MRYTSKNQADIDILIGLWIDSDSPYFDEWLSIHGMKSIRRRGTLIAVEFPSEKHYLQFLLKNS